MFRHLKIVVYEQNLNPSFTFTFVDTNDINNVVRNQLEPAISERGMQEFYFENFGLSEITASTTAG